MAVVETEALVLRTYKLAEADKIVVCFSHTAGLIRGVAQGSRKLKNRFGAALEPFTLIDLVYYQKEHHELVSLRQAEIIKSSFDLSSDPVTLSGLAYMADLVMQFAPPYQANEKLFRMVKACLAAIAETPTDLDTILRYFEVWLLKLEGFFPDIKHCADCHRRFSEREKVFVGADLAFRCRACDLTDGYALLPTVHAQLQATQRLAPRDFAQQSRGISARVNKGLVELTRRIIGQALERQPRVQAATAG